MIDREIFSSSNRAHRWMWECNVVQFICLTFTFGLLSAQQRPLTWSLNFTTRSQFEMFMFSRKKYRKLFETRYSWFLIQIIPRLFSVTVILDKYVLALTKTRTGRMACDHTEYSHRFVTDFNLSCILLSTPAFYIVYLLLIWYFNHLINVLFSCLGAAENLRKSVICPDLFLLCVSGEKILRKALVVANWGRRTVFVYDCQLCCIHVTPSKIIPWR